MNEAKSALRDEKVMAYRIIRALFHKMDNSVMR